MFTITSLSLSVATKPVIKDLSLLVKSGETHVIMGANGSGKTSLLMAIMGHPAYTTESGTLFFEGVNLLSLSTEQRARLGIFLIFQYPLEIPGVKIFTFLHEAYRSFTGKALSALEFMPLVSAALLRVGLNESFLDRSLHEGFSGGEKKRFELVQLILLQPRLVLIDELDSGLDPAGRKIMIELLHEMRTVNNQQAVIIVTHYRELADALKPDCLHTMHEGQLVTEELYQRNNLLSFEQHVSH